MATPEIVLGASLLTTVRATVQLPFIPSGVFYPLGVQTILIAHVMFSISFVVVTVKARLQGFPRHLEEAAMDLGANEWTTFWKVTFPLILPGIAGRRAARVQPVDRRLRHHQLHGGPDPDVPALFIYGSQFARHPGPGQCHRHDHLRGRGRARRAHDLVAAPRRLPATTRPAPPPDRGSRGGSTTMVDTAPDPVSMTDAAPRSRRSSRRSGAGSRTSTSTAARARG